MDGRQFCLGVLLNFSKSPLPNKIKRGVMSCQNILFSLVVAAVLTSFCDGQTDEDEGGTALKGSRHLRHLGSDLILKPLAATRSRLLPFRHVKQDELGSTKASQPGLAAKLKCLNPSVQCGDDRMTLTVNRIKVPHFLVDRGDKPHTRLSRMPTIREFSMKRSRRTLQFDAGYQGCRVNKEDGEYVLPLLFQGAPKTTSCPNVLTSPAVVCFPSKMVVKLGGVAARDLKIKASGTWQPLPLTCSSCGLTFKEVSGELALVAPYNTNLCVELKDEEYSLSLQWGDYELLAVCPSVPDTTTETPIPSSDGNPALQHPQNAYSQMFSQMFRPWPTSTPAPRAQLPPFFFVATNSPENQKEPEAQSPAVSFMPQLPQFFAFPRPELPAQTGIENTPVKRVQFPQMPQSPQYRVPFYSEFPMIPGIVQQATPSPLPATGTEPFPTSEPTQGNKDKFQAYLQSQFSVLPQHSFQSFFKHPLFSEDKTQVADYPKTDIEQLQPQRPQVFQFPMLYYPHNYPSKGQNAFTFTAAPATTTSEGTTTLPEHSFFQPHPDMPVYLLPEQPSMPVFLHPPSKPPTNPAPSDENEHKPVYHPMQPFYPFLPDQRETGHTRS